ncbi:hypothetical protein Tco_1411214 [Tanacetum coccineum]
MKESKEVDGACFDNLSMKPSLINVVIVPDDVSSDWFKVKKARPLRRAQDMEENIRSFRYKELEGLHDHSLTSRLSDRILKESCDVATMKKDIKEIKMINIELEHSVATFLMENETLKRHYQDLYNSIKRTRAHNIEKTTSLITQLNCNTFENVGLMAQLNDKMFGYDALKKIMKGKNVNSNFAKPSILGKPPSPKPLISSSLPKSRKNDSTHHYYLDQVQRIENKAKMMIFGCVSTTFSHLLRFKQTGKNSPSTPLERARNYESNAVTWLTRGKGVPPSDMAADKAADLEWVHMPNGTTQVVTRGRATNKISSQVRAKGWFRDCFVWLEGWLGHPSQRLLLLDDHVAHASWWIWNVTGCETPGQTRCVIPG